MYMHSFRPAAALALAGVALAGCSGKQHDASKDAPREVGVVVAQPERLELSTVLPGRTVAYRIAQVRPRVNGIILRRLYSEGAFVQAGQSLYELDPATYKAAVDAAQASLDKADANELTVRLKYERYQKLAARGDVSAQDRDDVTALHKQAEADQATARAALEAARINLDYTHVRSPISGRTSTSAYTEGALVTANQDAPLTTVTQTDPMYVDFVQPAGDVLKLREQMAAGRLQRAGKEGALVRLQLDDGNSYGQDGQLEFTGITVGDTTGTITLRAVFPNPAGRLLPGMYVRARLAQGVDEHALLLPQLAVARDSRGQALAMVVGAGGKVASRTLSVEDAGDNRWHVLAGLKAGEQVIVQGTQSVHEGDTVHPQVVGLAANGAAR
jgi:membrane fusion protein (multidrug efflux system)